MQALMDELGTVAYAHWWLLLEAIAGNTKPGQPFVLTRRSAWWEGQLRTKTKTVTFLLSFLERRGLLTWKKDGTSITVACPKLAKYRDEWSKRSGVTPKPTRESLILSEDRGQRDKERPPTEVQRKAARAARPHVCDELCQVADHAGSLGHPWRCDAATTRKALAKIRDLAREYADAPDSWLATASAVLSSAHASMTSDSRRKFFNSTHFARPNNFARYAERLAREQAPTVATARPMSLREMREALEKRDTAVPAIGGTR